MQVRDVPAIAVVFSFDAVLARDGTFTCDAGLKRERERERVRIKYARSRGVPLEDFLTWSFEDLSSRANLAVNFIRCECSGLAKIAGCDRGASGFTYLSIGAVFTRRCRPPVLSGYAIVAIAVCEEVLDVVSLVFVRVRQFHAHSPLSTIRLDLSYFAIFTRDVRSRFILIFACFAVIARFLSRVGLMSACAAQRAEVLTHCCLHFSHLAVRAVSKLVEVRKVAYGLAIVSAFGAVSTIGKRLGCRIC